MANEVLTIGGVTMPTPALGGVTVGREPIWSANTGRSASGKMVGTIVAVKTTIKVKWPPLTLAEAEKIENAVKGDFFTVVLKKDSSTVFSGTMYAGAPTYTIYSVVSGLPYAEGMAVDLIER